MIDDLKEVAEDFCDEHEEELKKCKTVDAFYDIIGGTEIHGTPLDGIFLCHEGKME